jgi:hypothetical protein
MHAAFWAHCHREKWGCERMLQRTGTSKREEEGAGDILMYQDANMSSVCTADKDRRDDMRALNGC